MKLPARYRSRWAGALAGAAGSILMGLTLFGTLLGRSLEESSYDWLFARKPVFAPAEVLLVNLDDESHDALNQPKDASWNRALHARLLERLQRAGARAVVFDILFDAAGPNPAADQALAAAMRGSGRVVLCGDKVRNGPKVTLDPPASEFSDASAGWGLSTFTLDPDMAVRMYQMQDTEVSLRGMSSIPSLAWKAAQIATRSDVHRATTPPAVVWLNYYGPPGTLHDISYHLALNTNLTADALFHDKVVFVGARRSVGFSGEGKDEFGTAYTRLTGTFSNGVEIHATAFLNLLRGEWLSRLPPLVEGLLIVLTGFGFGAGLIVLRPWTAAAVAMLGAVLLTVVVWWLFTNQLVWFGWLTLMAVIAAALAWTVLFNFYRAHVDNLILQKLLSLHLPPARVQQVMDDEELRRPGGQKQQMAFLFTDMDYFTTIPERVPTEQLFAQLNHYFSRAISCIHENDGTLVRLTGDGLFAVWNAPVAQPGFERLAIQAALTLRDRLRGLEIEGFDYLMRTRIGLHAGEACVGNCGSNERIDYTAIGSNVNITSRLEGLNKVLKTEILASEEIVSAAGAHFLVRPVGIFQLKGYDRVTHVNEVIGLSNPDTQMPPWISNFHEGLRQFQRRDFAGAELAFVQTLQQRPDDGPSQFYREQIQQLRASPPPADWLGEVRMREK